ncbi:hypothetical protein HYW55_03620 [Candidatus Gottesmanbacteria bacterium]|nr:hypothetical protein [Candidatus Gottesmanbacteria bacterium]
MKKIATLTGAAVLLAATLVPAFAANSCTNSTTGPFSNNTCTVNNTSNVTVNNVNDAQIINRVNSTSNTGNNSASYNTLGGSIVTGNATNNTTVSSVANISTTNLTIGSGGSNNIAGNEITGPYSNNAAYINNRTRVDVYNSNTATVKNSVNATADTGNNSADYNTGPATVQTGNSWLNLGVLTHVNDSLTDLNLGAGGTGNNTAFNSTTGPFSNNAAVINNDIYAYVNNVNDLQVKNRVNARALTGNNSASYNTLGGDITTGNATAGVGVNTEGNINTTMIATAMGGFANDASSSVTGPYSNNAQYVNNNKNVTVDNWNNKCQSHNADRIRNPWRPWSETDGCEPEYLGVFNTVNSVVDAGNNAGDYNTGGGSVMAGWASLMEAVQTHLNDVLNTLSL